MRSVDPTAFVSSGVHSLRSVEYSIVCVTVAPSWTFRTNPLRARSYLSVMIGARLTVRVSDWFPVPVRLLAEIVMVLVLAVVGVPEMTPVAVLRSRPAGNPVALKLVGVFFAVMV